MSKKNYRYTKNHNYLTDHQRKFYEENGYLIIRKLVDHNLLEECRQRFVDICDGKVDPGNMIVMKDATLMKTDAKGEFLIYKIQDFLYDDVLFKYTTYQPIVGILSSIIGDDITAINSMLINKPPDSSYSASSHPLHQDLHYFSFRPIDKICTVWTAMERTDTTNGCLFVVPGSHKGVLYPHVYPEGVQKNAVHGIQGLDHIPRVNVIMEEGDTVFFHPTLLHGSGPNCTKGFRKAISAHYANSNCHFIDLKGTSQQNIAEEVVQLAKRKGHSIVYNDFWVLKSRQIAGQPGVFQKYSNL